jgi:hypothetical protein
MELPGETYLFNLSLIAVTFTAVSALVMLMRQTMGGKLSNFDVYLITSYISFGFAVALADSCARTDGAGSDLVVFRAWPRSYHPSCERHDSALARHPPFRGSSHALCCCPDVDVCTENCITRWRQAGR